VQTILTTDRLLLREFTMDDVDLLVELDSDPAVMRFLTNGKPTPREQVEREQLPRILADYRRYPGLGRWAAIERSTGEFLGWLSLQPVAGGTEADLGYRLRRSTWGKGYASEGARALVGKAFQVARLERVFAQTMAVNTASRRVMEKAGLRYVRTFHLTFDDPIEGTEHGEVEYELRRGDWEAQRVARPSAGS
jgi:RimJ/RimL family protein N-acetyltransferase